MTLSAAKELAFEIVRGLWVAIPTPFSADGELDETALRYSVEHYIEGLDVDGTNRVVVEQCRFEGDGPALGDALFQGILDCPNGVVVTSDPYEITMDRIRTDDGKIVVVLPELLTELAELVDEQPPKTTDEYPFVLAASSGRGRSCWP